MAVGGADGRQVVVVDIIDGARVELEVVEDFYAMYASLLDLSDEPLRELAVLVGPSRVVGGHPHAVGLSHCQHTVGLVGGHVVGAGEVAVVVGGKQEVDVPHVLEVGPPRHARELGAAYQRDASVLGVLHRLQMGNVAVWVLIVSRRGLMVCECYSVQSLLIGFPNSEIGSHSTVALMRVQVQVGLDGTVTEYVGNVDGTSLVRIEVSLERAVLDSVCLGYARQCGSHRGSQQNHFFHDM